jgi:adenylate cyclase
MGEDEEGTRSKFNECLDSTVMPALEEHAGRLVKTMGDGFLVEFASVLGAVQAAVDIQSEWSRHQQDEPPDKRLELRIGVHSGDVIVEGEDIHGDGVNIAARLEGIAKPSGICISAMVREGVRNKLDVELSDLGERPLKNIAEPVHVYRLELAGSSGFNEGASSLDAMFRRPTVAVLPFENLSGDPEEDYFADGLTEDIITALSQWRSFPVIARNSTFAYKGTSPDIRKVGHDLGARYVIEGSVRKSGDRVRVTAQLINSDNGHHVWAERFDRDLSDIFELQDELSQNIAAIVAPELEFSQAPETRTKAPQNLDAWALVQRGYAQIWALDLDSVLAARKYFEQATGLDPDYARAHTGLAFSYHRELWLGHAEFSGATRERFVDAAKRAVALDETDSSAHVIMCMAFYWCRELDRGIAEAKRASELNPNDGQAQNLLGHGLTLAGQALEGVSCNERAIRLGPRDPRQGIWMWGLGFSHLTARQYDDAVEWLERSIQRQPGNPDAHLCLASSFGHLGRVEDARAAIETYRRLMPDASTRTLLHWPYRDESDYDHFVDGLRKASWEG